MTTQLWKRVLIESMIGPIVLSQFVVHVIADLVRAAAELSRWLIANLVNNTLIDFRADVILPFDHTHLAWAVVVFDCTQAVLFTGLLYLLAVWLYEEPQAMAPSN